MRKTANILGIPVDSVTMDQAVEKIKTFLVEDRVHTVFTPNSEIIMETQRNHYLKNILCDADLLVPDGAGVILASHILNSFLPERVTGIDLTKRIFSMPYERKLRFYLLGGEPGIAETAGGNLVTQYPNIIISGCFNGYFSKKDEPHIINNINKSNTEILLVALGKTNQETWIYENRDKLNVKVCMGIGGSLDVFAGKVKLAPRFFRNNGLEWLFRLYKQPWRYKRMLDLPKFMLKVIKTRIKYNNTI